MGAEKVEDKWKGKMKGREQMFLVAPFSHQLTDMLPQGGKATISLSVNKRQRTHDNANRKPTTARKKTLL